MNSPSREPLINGFPRVLIIAANPISKVQAVGLLLGSLFAGWPKDRLAQVYFPVFHDFPPDPTVCTRYLRVNAIGRATEENILEIAEAPEERVGAIGGAVYKLTQARSLRAPFIDPLREAMTSYPWLQRRLRRFARAFQPDVVFTLLGTIGIARAAATIAHELDVPVVPQFTDNWIDTRFKGSPFGAPLRRRLIYWTDRAMEKAPVLLTVSGVMRDEYALRFNKESHVVTNSVDEGRYVDALLQREDGEGPIRLVYAGNLALKRWQTLKLVGEALRSLRAEGLHGKLEVYCTPRNREMYAKSMTIPGVVSLEPWVPASKLPELLVGADVLIHVESPDPEILDYTRHAFSTKLSQYLMAARCILLVGPKEAGAMSEISRIGGGLVIEPSTEEVKETLRRLLSDPQLREDMGRQAREVGRRHFEAARNRERFRRILVGAANR